MQPGEAKKRAARCQARCFVTTRFSYFWSQYEFSSKWYPSRYPHIVSRDSNRNAIYRELSRNQCLNLWKLACAKTWLWGGCTLSMSTLNTKRARESECWRGSPYMRSIGHSTPRPATPRHDGRCAAMPMPCSSPKCQEAARAAAFRRRVLRPTRGRLVRTANSKRGQLAPESVR